MSPWKTKNENSIFSSVRWFRGRPSKVLSVTAALHPDSSFTPPLLSVHLHLHLHFYLYLYYPPSPDTFFLLLPLIALDSCDNLPD